MPDYGTSLTTHLDVTLEQFTRGYDRVRESRRIMCAGCGKKVRWWQSIVVLTVGPSNVGLWEGHKRCLRDGRILIGLRGGTYMSGKTPSLVWERA